MTVEPTLLIIEDEKNEREGLKKYLAPKGYDIHLAESAESGVKMARDFLPDVILTDLVLPGMDGLWVLEKAKEISPDSTVIIFTSYGTVENAVKAIKRGAFDYLTKPIDFDELEATLERAVRGKQLERENIELKRELLERSGVQQIVAQSQKMKDVLKIVEKVAPSNASVLVEGESGTGKEVVAHLIHELSPRRSKAFVAVHCASLAESLLSSELFGHERGAFTGANERKIGRFERAHTGTLFLDEIAEIPEEMQVKLLRVLQNGEFERVGGTKTIRSDVRLVCATNRTLSEEVREGRFREDLYYRINVIKIEIPPLRQRPEDIPPMVKQFVEHFAKINVKALRGVEDDAMEALKKYPWPGNVRELKNVVERMVVLTNDPFLKLHHIPLDIRGPSPADEAALNTGASPGAGNYQIKDMERDLIQRKLNEVKGNKSLAAKELGISRRTLYRKLTEYGLS
jgi:DNA-binding NtrC family response regulator